MIKFTLFGAGRIGQVHAANLIPHPQVDLRYVADVYRPAAEKIAAQCDATVIGPDDPRAMDDVDAVMICSATDTHADLIERAVAAGKAILCEKPIDLDIARVRECVEVVENARALCALGFNRRHDPNFQDLANRLRDGQIGSLEQLIITSRDPAPPPIEYINVSGGLFRDMMIHDFDIARWLLDEDIASVYAVGSCLVDPAIGEAGDVDTAMVVMTTRNGKLCKISNSRRATYGYDQRIEAFGEKGMLQAQNVLESSVVQTNASGQNAAKPLLFFLERYNQAYRKELDDFIAAIAEQRPPMTNQQDGLKALELAEAAIESFRLKQPVML